MRCIVLLLLIFPVGFSASAQGNINAVTHVQAFSSNPEATDWFLDITSRFDRSRSTSDLQFAKKLYYKVHNRYLKRYREYTDFDQLIEDRTYDCLTGTALYALLFEYFDLPYQIHEEPFHINLTVQLDGETYLIESTDPMQGFQQVTYREPGNVGLNELNGLLLYNQAVKLNNQQQFQQAYKAVAFAEQLYPSSRINHERKVIEQNLILSVASSFR